MPPWRCMKREFLMMALLILRRRAPGKDIDVYLQPLIDELKELWGNGVRTFDIIDKEYFTMRAAILWTIHDFPAYGTVSGYSTQGYKACPVCEDDTSSFRLRGKTCFMGHRRYLCPNHQWRNDMEYDGTIEQRSPPRILTGDEILDKLKGVWKCRAGKNDKIIKDDKEQMKDACYENNTNWRRKSIFWELEYWPKLKLRHNLDVMHIEKNICDSVVGTIFSIDGKSKDTEKARLDLQDLNIRKQLHMKNKGNKWFKPVACYTLSAKERQEFCTFIKSVKFPDGYAANISRNVNMKDGKLFGLKSHDCHILLQRTLYVKDLDELEKGVVLTLCKLESIFPPAFFDVMIHLMVHFPLEAKLGGPVQIRWMYSIEREHRLFLQSQGILDINQMQKNEFSTWFENKIKKMNETIYVKAQEDLYAIAMQPKYDGNICDFYVVINEIWEVHYLHLNKVILFKCSWHNTNGSDRMYSEYNFTSININSEWFEDEPFVLANQVSLVFYLDDIKKSKDNKDWKVVQKVNHHHIWDIPSKPMDGEVDDEDPTINSSEAYQEESSNDIGMNFDSTTNDTNLIRDDIEDIECDNHQLLNELQINHNDQVQSDINSDDTDE
ncbi:uncharacterized protein LOC133824907 [Humulus lupulus]|uniref:uncharacterized protein LOC133824907 n=1 Tax=Humulus lupulus TaxID=3486 RepID=UPI002B40CA7E|nr:uncharacterized protein LOC133824907 [Humulus lupulus]